MGAAPKIHPRRLSDMSDEEIIELVSDGIERGIERALAKVVTQPEGRLMGPAEAAHFLGISTGALRHHVARKHIAPDVRAGKDGLRAHQFSRATLEAFRRRNGRQEEK